MPLAPLPPIGALGLTLRDQLERVRAQEQTQHRLTPSGMCLPSASYTSTAVGLYAPSGWDYTATIGPTGVLVVFGQSYLTSAGGAAGLVIQVDGGPYLEIGADNTAGFLPTTGSIVLTDLTPNSTVTIQLVLQQQATGTYVWTAPFLVVWPL